MLNDLQSVFFHLCERFLGFINAARTLNCLKPVQIESSH